MPDPIVSNTQEFPPLNQPAYDPNYGGPKMPDPGNMQQRNLI